MHMSIALFMVERNSLLLDLARCQYLKLQLVGYLGHDDIANVLSQRLLQSA